MNSRRNKRSANRQRKPGLRLGLSLLALFSMVFIFFSEITERDKPSARLLMSHVADITEQAVSLWEDFSDSQESQPDPFLNAAMLEGRVTRVSDGDTFTLRYYGVQNETIRLHGIDAPERDQPHGAEAGAALARMVADRDVRVRVEDTDIYGRIVGTVFLDDENINLRMVREGHAWWYEFYARNDADLREAHANARAARRGLWAGNNPMAPWDYRRRNR
jgi:endonuclease YncB( thermonuclease family)